MIIEDKYFDLLHTLVYDKRRRMSGILSSIEISRLINGYNISFLAYMNHQYADIPIFVEDFEKGNVVFLLPFGVKYQEKEMEEMAEEHTEKIKAFFGDKFHENMIMRISEDDRQEEIRKWGSRVIGLENWTNHLWDKETNEEVEKDEKDKY